MESGTNIEYFHASEDRQHVRDKVFRILKNHMSYEIDSVIMEKSKLVPKYRGVESFYPYILRKLLDYALKRAVDRGCSRMTILTDRLVGFAQKKKAVEKAIKQRMAGIEVPYSLYHHSSKSNYGLQAIDYINWAIFVKWERAGKEMRPYNGIRSRIFSEWEIFAHGRRHHY